MKRKASIKVSKARVNPVKIVATETTIPVKIENDKPIYVDRKDTQSLAPNTTEEEDVVTAGQRKVNLIWENTQSIVALLVCVFTMIAGLMIVISMVFYKRDDMQIPTIFSMAFGTVVGFYFSRTNHQAIGGIGKKPNENQKYEGR